MDKQKQNDKMASLGSTAVYKANRLADVISDALKNEELKQEVMDYIFSGDVDAVSPLAEIRKNA